MQIYTHTLPGGAQLIGYLRDRTVEMPAFNTRPAILILPGGGYAWCSRREADPVAMQFLQAGYNVFTLYYTCRSDETVPALRWQPLIDAAGAILHIRRNAEQFGTDPAKNHHLINAGALAKMKDGVLLVNTARGTLIDPDALIAGLESGKIGGAGLDVIEDETGIYYYNRMGQAIPNRELNLLRSYPNVIVSPHTAFYTDVNVASMVQSPFEALDAYAHGQPYAGEVQL